MGSGARTIGASAHGGGFTAAQERPRRGKPQGEE
jgi:hypothetical protein